MDFRFRRQVYPNRRYPIPKDGSQVLASDLDDSKMAEYREQCGIILDTIRVVGLKSKVPKIFRDYTTLVQTMDKLQNSGRLLTLATTWNSDVSDLAKVSEVLDSVKNTQQDDDTLQAVADLRGFVLKAAVVAAGKREGTSTMMQPAFEVLSKIHGLAGMKKVSPVEDLEHGILMELLQVGFSTTSPLVALVGDDGNPLPGKTTEERKGLLIEHDVATKKFKSLLIVNSASTSLVNSFHANGLVTAFNKRISEIASTIDTMNDVVKSELETAARPYPSCFVLSVCVCLCVRTLPSFLYYTHARICSCSFGLAKCVFLSCRLVCL